MLWYTHLAFGFLVGLASLRFMHTNNIYIFFACILLGALLPDIDTPKSKLGSKLGIISKAIKAVFGHRGVVHTIWGMIVICGLFWLFISRTYSAALFLGFFSHIIIDGLTKKGINFLHPVSKVRLSGFIETGTAGELILIIVIIAFITILIL